jgi:hypothetical protein
MVVYQQSNSYVEPSATRELAGLHSSSYFRLKMTQQTCFPPVLSDVQPSLAFVLEILQMPHLEDLLRACVMS